MVGRTTGFWFMGHKMQFIFGISIDYSREMRTGELLELAAYLHIAFFTFGYIWK